MDHVWILIQISWIYWSAQTISYYFWWETVHIVEEFHLEVDTSHLFHTRNVAILSICWSGLFLALLHYVRGDYRTMPVARCMDMPDLTEIIMSIHGSVARCHFYPTGCDVAIPWSFWNLEEAARSSSEWGWLHLLPWRRFRRSVFTCKNSWYWNERITKPYKKHQKTTMKP